MIEYRQEVLRAKWNQAQIQREEQGMGQIHKAIWLPNPQDNRRLFSLKQSVLRTSRPGKDDFYGFLQKMKSDMNAELEREDDGYFELNAKALIGDPQAVSFFMNEIEKYLRKTPFTGKVPEAYGTAAEALFHEWKGFGPAYRWFTDRAYSESTGLQMIGRQIFYNHRGKFVVYPYEMPSLDPGGTAKTLFAEKRPR
ncbi:hypothetical protein AMQ83_17635 [Paenibacillus riograndensis]|nr:hypothetical protein AMQ83_17635 [Paenibacillus riograndensis]